VASSSIQPFSYNRHEPKTGGYHNVAMAEAYLHAKFHLDPSNRNLMHSARTSHTDRQGRRDKQADRQTTV